MDADEKAASSSVDVDQRQIENAFLDINWQLFLGAKWACASDQKPRMSVGRFRSARLDFLAADLSGQFFGRHLAIAVHEHDQRFGVFVFHHQCFDHGMFVDIELARRNAGAAVLFVVVKMA